MITTIIFLFPKNVSFADIDPKGVTYTFEVYTTEDTLEEGFRFNDFYINSDRNWYEYEYNGENYVVLSATTTSLIKSDDEGTVDEENDGVHYFEIYDIFQFSYNNGTYNGIILGTIDKPNKLGVYVAGKTNSLDGAEVQITEDGTYSTNADNTSDIESNTIIEFFANFFIRLGDSIQTLIISGVSDTEKNSTDAEIDYYNGRLTYSTDDIKKDRDLKGQINITNAVSISKRDLKGILKTAEIPNEIDNKKGEKEEVYTTETEIPVIPTDLYSLSINKVNLFDVDFLNANNKNPNKIWKIIKNFVYNFSRIALYIAAALIISMIIWRGILLVKGSFRDSPKESAKSKKVINNVIKTTIMIVGVYVVATLMLYFYQIILQLIIQNNDTNYLIRLTVTDTYTFNTNIIGWIRYKTLSNNIMSSFGWSAIYLFATIFNLIWFFIMSARTILVGILIIIAPFTAVMYMSGKTAENSSKLNIFHFRNWFRIYLICIWMPISIVILYRVLLMI